MKARRWIVAFASVILSCGIATISYAAEDRTKIDDINLSINSTIEAGSDDGNVYVSTSDSEYTVGSADILNEADDDWKGGMTPRVSVELYARSGYYFGSIDRNSISFYGDDASYVSTRREDDKETLVVVFKLDKLDNGDLSITNASWDESSATANWDENGSAKYYQVRLYRDSSSVTSIRTTYDTSYDFSGDFTRRGDYYFTVRAVGSGSEKGDWESSDSWYVTAQEADDFSYNYGNSWGPGGSGSSSGGPGASSSSGNYGGSYGPGGYDYGPGGYSNYGPGGNSGSGGGPGVSGGGSTGYSTAANTGNNWCRNQQGWWFQYEGGGYPVNRWELIDGRWYCFGQDGYIRCGWINWDGKWYYTDGTGALLVNTRTPDGCYVGGDGAWIQ